MSITSKLCPKCQQEKSIGDFTFNKQRNTYAKHCKACISNNTKQWLKAFFESDNPEVILDATFYKMLQSSRSNAKVKKLPFTLTLPNVRALYQTQKGKCFYTGVPMTLRSNGHLDRDPLLISFDRKDPTLGYTPENTVLCCWGINALKGHHSETTLFNTLKLFHENAKLIGKIV